VAGMDLVEFQGESIDMEALYRNHNFEKMRATGARYRSDGLGLEPRHSGLHHDLATSDGWLAEFDEFDPTSAVTRYPVDTTGKPTMAEARCVNLFDFAMTIAPFLKSGPCARNNHGLVRLSELRRRGGAVDHGADAFGNDLGPWQRYNSSVTFRPNSPSA